MMMFIVIFTISLTYFRTGSNVGECQGCILLDRGVVVRKQRCNGSDPAAIEDGLRVRIVASHNVADCLECWRHDTEGLVPEQLHQPTDLVQ